MEHIVLEFKDGAPVVAILVDSTTLEPLYESHWSQNECGSLCVAVLVREEILLTAAFHKALILDPQTEMQSKAIERMRDEIRDGETDAE